MEGEEEAYAEHLLELKTVFVGHSKDWEKQEASHRAVQFLYQIRPLHLMVVKLLGSGILDLRRRSSSLWQISLW